MKDLNDLFALVAHNQYNLRVLHWKMSGISFDCYHEKMNMFIDKFSELIDEIAEMNLMLGESVLNIKEIDSRLDEKDLRRDLSADIDYVESDVNNILKLYFDQILDTITELRKNEYPSYINSKLDEIETFFRLEDSYKLTQKNKKKE